MKELNIRKYVYNKQLMFFTGLFFCIILLFRKAFHIDFFLDDFFFLKIGQAQSIGEFLNFFYPVKDYFYRPIPTETFYFLINLTGGNLILAHSIVFITYFVGLYYLYRVLRILFSEQLIAYVTVFMYGIHFTHVFQLYQLATFIEVALFTFLTVSTYFFLQKNYVLSIVFFICALMSKETAVLFPLFLVFITAVQHYRAKGVKQIIPAVRKKVLQKVFIPYFAIAAVFVLIFKFGVSNVTTIDIYQIQLDPRLIVNNAMWYTLWALGFPNFLPDFMSSIFSIPFDDFWEYLLVPQFKVYFYGLITYWILVAGTVASMIITRRINWKTALIVLIICGGLFLLFISPTLPIIHRWMVRLTVPVVFIVLFQAWLLVTIYKQKDWYRYIAYGLLGLYTIWNVFGVHVHESSSLFLLESSITNNLRTFIEQYGSEISQKKVLYFVDSKEGYWGGSKKLKVTFHDNSFVDHFLPGSAVEAIYGVDGKPIPKGAFTVDSTEILGR